MKKLVFWVASAAFVGGSNLAYAETFHDNFDTLSFTAANWQQLEGSTGDWQLKPKSDYTGNPADSKNLWYIGKNADGDDTTIATKQAFATNSSLYIDTAFQFIRNGSPYVSHEFDIAFSLSKTGSSDPDNQFTGYYTKIEYDKSTNKYFLGTGKVNEDTSINSDEFYLTGAWMYLDIQVTSNQVISSLYYWGAADPTAPVVNPGTTGNFISSVTYDLDGSIAGGVIAFHADNLDEIRLGQFWVGGDTYSAPVPVPSAMLLLGTGIAGLSAIGRRKRS